MITILLVTDNSRNAALDLEYEHRLIVRAVREGGDESITVEALPTYEGPSTPTTAISEEPLRIQR